MTASKVLLWRHGRTTHNAAHIWQGQLDTQLDDVGRAEAVSAAAVLAGVVLDGAAPVRLVTSDLARARDTAEVLAGACGVPVVVDVRLREVHGGAWQGLTREEIVAAGMGDHLAACMRGEDVRIGGRERRSEAGQRCAAAIREHAAELDGGVLVAVGHGAALRAAMAALVGLSFEASAAFVGLRNCAWVELAVVEPGPWRLAAYNVTVPRTAGPAHRVPRTPVAAGSGRGEDAAVGSPP